MPEASSDLDRRYLWHPVTQRGELDAEGPMVVERAEGTDLIGADGRRYIDGTSSLWSSVHGHRHPRIDRAVRKQLERVAHSTPLGLTHAGAAELAAELVAIAPPGLRRALYSDSGSGAAETALKIAFRYWQRLGGQHRRRTSFVSLSGGRHADIRGSASIGAVELQGTQGLEPFRSHRVGAGDAEALERVLEMRQEEVAAVILEPLVEAAAGVRVHPPGYLRRVRELCTRHGAFLICDEATTGVGRTGTMFACEQERVVPDFLCLGNGLTGGYLPLGAILTTERIFEGFLGASEEDGALLHGSASAGNPLACAAALANLEAFEKEGTLVRLQPKIRLLGELLDGIGRMHEVSEVRGRGFMAGIDLGDHGPALRIGARVAAEARRRGVALQPLGDVIALLPPLTISKADLRRMVETVGEAIAAASRGAHGEREATVEPMPERTRPLRRRRAERAARHAA